MSYHLPVLLNPLINAVCNCSEPNESPLKKLFSQLQKKRQFLLLVPPTELLLYYTAESANVELSELCYTPAFVGSHILLLGSEDNEVDNSYDEAVIRDIEARYDLHPVKCFDNTWKFISWKNRTIFQFSKSGEQILNKITIHSLETIPVFNDYMKTSHNTIKLLHIEGTFVEGPISCHLQSNIDICKELLKHHPEHSLEIDGCENEDKPLKATVRKGEAGYSRSKATFDSILRLNTHWSSEFEKRFREYRDRNQTSGPQPELFHEIVDDMCARMELDNLFKSLVSLRRIVYEYVELNLFDDTWTQIVKTNKKDETDTSQFKDISVHQVDTEFTSIKYDHFYLENVLSVEKNVANATVLFQKFHSTDNFSSKAKVLVNTLKLLTGSEDDQEQDDSMLSEGSAPITIDADKLMNLFVLVACRAQVKNLKSHLYYLQNFYQDENNIKFGILGYAISTFEAVVCYFEELSTRENYKSLVDSCRNSEKLIRIISSSKSLTRKTIIKILKQHEQSLRYRDAAGNSILSLCITHRRNDILVVILELYDDYYPIEDLYMDENLDGSSLLVQALRHNNETAALILLKILKNNCPKTELIKYINRRDKNKRTASHYLTNELRVLDEIGMLIDWKLKDDFGQTPLFTIFRSYDQENYEEMSQKAYGYTKEWYKNNDIEFSFHDHTDEKGNSLLHILKNNISFLLSDSIVDVNITNNRGITPLMTNVRYKRKENVSTLLLDKRTLLEKQQDHGSLTAFDFARDPGITNLLGGCGLKQSAWNIVYAHSLKYIVSHWTVCLTILDGGCTSTVPFKLKTLRGLLRVLIKKRKSIFLPLQELVDDLTTFNRIRFSELMKERLKKTLPLITNCLSSLVALNIIPIETFKTEDEAVKWIKMNSRMEQHKENSNTITPEEIGMIQNFSKFNISELKKTVKSLNVLKKLILFLELKACDYSKSFEISSRMISELSSKKFRDSLKLPESAINFFDPHTATILLNQVEFLSSCINNLFNFIYNSLEEEIMQWWHVYGEVLNAHKHYNRVFPELANQTMDSKELILRKMSSNPKRLKLEERLTVKIKEITKKLNSIGFRIKRMHEDIAEDLSRFLEFKSKFTLEGILDSTLFSQSQYLATQSSKFHEYQKQYSA
ncbi:hypothetical protein RNJ44_00283 [Nakaseomyces bracarensis]|uniref:VPS9 domain-containing protein n=1 Tax=Nakaseomyces bracarensis TaxID=273131 RepID=A0ABR4NTE4_9SACH